MDTLTIGQLARAADVGVETIRFYERRGLLAEPPRRPSGYRQYEPEAADRLRFIRRAKELGFTLDEIGELLALRARPTENRDRVRAAASAKIDDIERRIADLEQMRGVLARLVSACEERSEHADAAMSGCPILEALEPRADRTSRTAEDAQ
ncbi:MAG: MerR family DNA-binding protein [Acidobacteriota bacterium]